MFENSTSTFRGAQLVVHRDSGVGLSDLLGDDNN
jgi:hypothetical protein